MQATRQNILDYLDARGSASAQQMAQAFGMSTQNLRRHLRILEQRGLIAVSQPAASGRGRPQLTYSLTAQAQPDHLAGLSRALLQGLRPASLRPLAQRLLGQPGGLQSQRPARNTSQRLVAAMRKLEPMGYRPRWEARPGGPQVVLGHCPFAAIIEQHPELCQVDAHMLEELLGADPEQASKLQPGPQGTPQCIFRIKERRT
ncbi:MAG: helix-turn-helix domain-containing protein [Anaerolineales bacterium]|nr:MAG: helix-turn-helix domain-containing protein [Anaerolineales bacterium]